MPRAPGYPLSSGPSVVFDGDATLPPAGSDSAERKLDAAGLKAILESCRHDLRRLRQAVPSEGPHAHQSGQCGTRSLETRLGAVAERLENVVDGLDRIVARNGPAYLPAAAELLAREADHRIRNSLQLVIGLLNRQAESSEDQSVRDALSVANARLAAVAQVHASLHQVGNQNGYSPEIELCAHVRELCIQLGKAMGVDGIQRSLQVDLEPQTVAPAAAQQIGLLIAELVSNALRHAFSPDRPGIIGVTGGHCDVGYRVCVEDNGKGLPRDFDLRRRRTGLGLRLVNVLADQAGGWLEVDGPPGTRITLTLPLPSRRPRG